MISIEQPTIPLNPDVFKLLRDMLYEHCGVWLDEQSKFFVEGRLQETLRRHRFGSFKDLYYFLKYDARRAEEFATVIDLLTIHETYFFREDHQLHALYREILPELMKRRQDRTLRIWSAGCSTGEEVYSVAMLLASQPGYGDWRVEISGSDISQRVLEVARRGVYPASAFRTTPPDVRKRFFHQEGEGFRVDDSIKRMVNFFSFNLADVDRAAVLPKMDVILCRNVIIYFDSAVKKRVVEMFSNRLRPGGYLLLGHSESLMSISTAFSLRHLRHDIVYQKEEGISAAA
ncbi:MAG: protein-glutamate O-methyltransferase CheR [Nitrospirota bacterium]